MKISVIIPAYNEEKNIVDCLKSLSMQSCQPDEIIVVDNNSSDSTVELVKSFKSKIPIRVVTEKQQGIIYARSRGFDEAKYPLIARIDADSCAFADWLEKLSRHFEDDEIVAVGGGLCWYDGPKALRNKLIYNNSLKLISKMSGETLIIGSNFMMRKSTWEKIRSYASVPSPYTHEDFDLSIYLNEFGKVIFDEHAMISSSARRMTEKPHEFFGIYGFQSLMNLVHSRKREIKKKLRAKILS